MSTTDATPSPVSSLGSSSHMFTTYQNHQKASALSLKPFNLGSDSFLCRTVFWDTKRKFGILQSLTTSEKFFAHMSCLESFVNDHPRLYKGENVVVSRIEFARQSTKRYRKAKHVGGIGAPLLCDLNAMFNSKETAERNNRIVSGLKALCQAYAQTKASTSTLQCFALRVPMPNGVRLFATTPSLATSGGEELHRPASDSKNVNTSLFGRIGGSQFLAECKVVVFNDMHRNSPLPYSMVKHEWPKIHLHEVNPGRFSGGQA